MTTESTQQKITEIDQLRRQARAWRVGGVLAAAAVSATFILVLWSEAQQLFQPGPTHDEFLTELKGGLQREVMPQVKTLTVQTVNELVPRVQQEVVNLQTRVPELTAALTAELTLLQQNVPSRIDKILGASVSEVIRGREAKIRALYPDVTDQNVQAITALLSNESALRVNKVAQQVIAPYQDVMTKLVTDLNHIRDTEPVSTPGRTPALEVATLCASLLQAELLKATPPSAVPLLTATLTEAQK